MLAQFAIMFVYACMLNVHMYVYMRGGMLNRLCVNMWYYRHCFVSLTHIIYDTFFYIKNFPFFRSFILNRYFSVRIFVVGLFYHSLYIHTVLYWYIPLSRRLQFFCSNIQRSRYIDSRNFKLNTEQKFFKSIVQSILDLCLKIIA